jgi:TRAP-type C4-dicarboxylate transport system substrate-binding protein
MTSFKLRSVLASAVAAAVVLVGLGAGTASAGERRIATLAPKGSAWVNILEEGARRLEKDTEGRIKIKFYPGGTQGDEKDVIRKIKLKQLDGAALTTVGLSFIYPGIRVLQLPYLFDTVEEVDYVRAKMWPYFQQKFEEKGFKLMYPGDVGWTHLYSNQALESLADVKKVKFWAWTDDPIVRAYFKKLKVSSVPLGGPEVQSALKTGRITGCYGSPLAAVALQWYTEVSHATEEPVGYGIGAMVIRLDVWEADSAADKKAEDKVGKKIGNKLVKRVRKDNERAKKAMKKNGIKFTATPEKLKKKLVEDAEAIWTELAGDVYTKKELELVLKYRKEFRSK